MSALTKLAAVRLQEAEILRTECASCGHPLRSHPVSARRESCIHFDVVRHPSGDANHAKLAHCKCKGWADPEDRLAL